MIQRIFTLLIFTCLLSEISAQDKLHFDIELLTSSQIAKEVSLEIISEAGESFDLGNIKRHMLKIDLEKSTKYTLRFKKSGLNLKSIIIDTNCPVTYAQAEPILIKVLIPEELITGSKLAGVIQYYKEYQKFYYKKEESLL